MPHYQTKSERKYRYDMIAKAEGDQCLLCYIENRMRRGPPQVKLIIEHSDNILHNWSWGNLHLACYSHNKKLEKLNVQEKIKLLEAYSDQLERERERENLPTWKTVLKDELPYDTGSPEMQANKKFEPRWLRYVHSVMSQYGSQGRKEIISAAAAYCNCSIQTSSNYYIKHTSAISPFMETLDEDGSKIIKYRN